MVIDDVGGRKFVFAMFVVLCAFLLVISGQISFKEFMTIITYALGIFSVSNAIAHLSDNKTVVENRKDDQI